MVVSLLAYWRLCYVERKIPLSALWKTKVNNFVSFVVLQMFCSTLRSVNFDSYCKTFDINALTKIQSHFWPKMLFCLTALISTENRYTGELTCLVNKTCASYPIFSIYMT